LDGNVPADDQVTSLTGVGGSGPVAFATTHWSMVLEAQSESPAAQEALEKLCRIYWRPIYSFVRREGIRPDHTYAFRFKFFTFDTQNIFTGWTIIAGTTTVNPTGDTNAGSATVKVYNTSGVLLVSLCASTAGTRFKL
jgi:hypothetical protein